MMDEKILRGTLPPSAGRPWWIPGDVTTYASCQIDIDRTLEFAKPVIDSQIGEGGFRDALRGIKKDEFGPKVDMQRNFFGALGNRITFITDLKVPSAAREERILVAVEANDAIVLRRTIDRIFAHDHRDSQRIVFRNVVIWEVGDWEQDSGPEIEIEKPVDTEKGSVFTVRPGAVFCVAHGHLFFASHRGLLEKVLAANRK